MSSEKVVKHSAGPWKVEEHPNTGFGLDVTTSEETICQHIDVPANAALIAAAPELWEALKIARTALVREGYDDNFADIKAIEAALSKAGGQL